MKNTRYAAIFLSLIATIFAPCVLAQNGSIEFVARATPSGGLEEPVRGFPIFLLSKSFEDIQGEAESAVPKVDMDAYIDKLDVSKELKVWMKKNHWLTLSGEDFIHKLHPPDVMEVPEFFQAYIDRNSGYQSDNFPKPKYKPAEEKKDPAKFARLKTEYKDAVRHYMEQNPASIDGIDLNLSDIDPSQKWQQLEGKRAPEVRHRALGLAQSKYLVSHTETNLQGQGFFREVPAGDYWLSTLDEPANVGDARPLWDAPLVVRANQTTYIALSNVNAVHSSQSSP